MTSHDRGSVPTDLQPEEPRSSSSTSKKAHHLPLWQETILLLAVALVLGEYTVSSLLHYNTLPVVIVLLGKSDAPESMAAALASILFTALLLVALSFLDRRRRTSEGK